MLGPLRQPPLLLRCPGASRLDEGAAFQRRDSRTQVLKHSSDPRKGVGTLMRRRLPSPGLRRVSLARPRATDLAAGRRGVQGQDAARPAALGGGLCLSRDVARDCKGEVQQGHLPRESGGRRLLGGSHWSPGVPVAFAARRDRAVTLATCLPSGQEEGPAPLPGRSSGRGVPGGERGGRRPSPARGLPSSCRAGGVSAARGPSARRPPRARGRCSATLGHDVKPLFDIIPFRI